MPNLLAFSPLDTSIVLFYFALVSTIGILIARREKSADPASYFLGGRSLPTWAVSISLVATMLSTATFVAVPDTAFAGSLAYLSLSIGGIIAVFIVAFFFVPRLYAAGTVTIYGFLAQRFGQPARIAVSAAFILGRMLASGARLFLAAIPLCLLLFGSDFPTPAQLILAILLIAAVGTFYTTLGGVRAVVWVDVLQFALVLLTAAISIIILLHRIPLSLPQIFDALSHTPAVAASNPATAPSKLHLIDFSTDLSNPYTLLAAIVGITFLNVAAFGTDQDLAQRFLITKSARGGALSVILSQFIGIVVVFAFLAIGLLLYLFYSLPGHPAAKPDPHSIYPFFLLTQLPPGLSGLAITGFFAIAQGSLDSAMNALASSIVADIYLPLKFGVHASACVGGGGQSAAHAPPHPEPSRLTVAAVGLTLALFAIACALAYDPAHHSLLDFVQGLMTYALSGMLAVFCAALFTNRGNNASVIAALLTGPLVVALLQDFSLPLWSTALLGHPLAISWPYWTPIASTLAFLVCIIPAGRQNPVV